jgi:hypothetical protein
VDLLLPHDRVAIARHNSKVSVNNLKVFSEKQHQPVVLTTSGGFLCFAQSSCYIEGDA